MREIKFRAWDKTKKEMLFNFLPTPNSNYAVSFSITKYGSAFSSIDKISLEFMQFTGLKDKNGKEIYCSDIVKGKFNVDDVADYIYLSLTDKEKETGEKLFTIPDDIIEFARMHLPDDLEVIGNVYEHKELLKEQK